MRVTIRGIRCVGRKGEFFEPGTTVEVDEEEAHGLIRAQLADHADGPHVVMTAMMAPAQNMAGRGFENALPAEDEPPPEKEKQKEAKK